MNKAAAERAGAGAQARSVSSVWKGFPKGLRVLLVEPSESDRQSITALLEQCEYKGAHTFTYRLSSVVLFVELWAAGSVLPAGASSPPQRRGGGRVFHPGGVGGWVGQSVCGRALRMVLGLHGRIAEGRAPVKGILFCAVLQSNACAVALTPNTMPVSVRPRTCTLMHSCHRSYGNLVAQRGTAARKKQAASL